MSKEHFYNIIRSPAITEKGTLVSEHNQVVFNVARDATKPAIKKAIEGLFGVKVKSVNTLVRKGKQRRFKGQLATLSDVKRAYVTLEEGQRLDVTTGL
ncbi:MAG TPA: 50S ribosomal protein L23 [Aestuariivirga sp.]|jgi:large subunit ribosomal protein L23|nr:50S ribosomal protein L23 [Aestuariivirga sp.]